MEEESCIGCKGEGYIKVTCPQCGGNGEVEEECPDCMGKGVVNLTEKEDE